MNVRWRVSVCPSGIGLGNVHFQKYISLLSVRLPGAALVNIYFLKFTAVPNCPFFIAVPNCPGAKLSSMPIAPITSGVSPGLF